LDVQFENDTARWLGGGFLLFENRHLTKVFCLLARMWRAHRLLRISGESAEYRDKLAAAIENLEEACPEGKDRLDQTVDEARGLFDTCPDLPLRPN